MEPLKICFIASEVHPFSKTGGLADVASSLPIALGRAGHDVRVITPLYARIDRSRWRFRPEEAIQNVPIGLGGRILTFSLLSAVPAEGERPVYFVDCPALYDRKEFYTNDPDEHVRFAFFSRAAIETAQRMKWAPDVFHCHDWHAALTPLYLKTLYAWDALFRRSRTLLTIHNIGYQGIFPASILGDLDLLESAHLFHGDDLRAGRINFLKTGLLHADSLSTVSRTYAQEIQTEDYGAGLHDILRARKDVLVGIVNGVDYGEWDPAVDPHIPFRYSAKNLAAKGKNRKALSQKMGLDEAGATPLMGIVSRLTGQKGFDLFFQTLPERLARGRFRMAVLGTGEPPIEGLFEKLQAAYPGRLSFYKGFSNELAHLIEAGSDLFLMPSRYEPCGLNQMYSMKYGTVPLVRKTGGLADTVTPFDPRTARGTGFVFEPYTPDALGAALDDALALWDDRKAWRRLMLNGMAQDFSWGVQVREYANLYAKMAGRQAA
jgi:starch synthase